MSEVNQVNMARWIVALRSGKYKQGRGRLRPSEDEFCCLGVVCDISNAGVWRDDRWYDTPDHFSSSAMVLPDCVTEWLSLGDMNPAVGENIACGTANDDMGWSFNQIADALESRYLPNTTAEKVLEEK